VPTTPSTRRTADRRKWETLLGVGLGVFMSTLDGGIVNLALPALMRIFGTSFPTVQWVALSYLMVLTSTMVGAARLGDLYGRKRLYLLGILLFTVASLGCALAPGVGWLIAARAAQGLGAVFLGGLGIALVAEAFPPSERGRALGWIGTVVSVGIALGPTVGGVLLGLGGWRWLFLVNLPVGTAAFLVVSRFVAESERAPRGERFDFPGSALLFLTLAGYTAGMTLGQRHGFVSPAGLLPLGVAALALPAFLAVERNAAHPVLDLRLFHGSLFGVNLLMGFLTFVLMGSNFLLPFFLDLVLRLPPERAGLLLATVPVSMGLVAPWAGTLADRWGSRGISVAGLALLTGACLLAGTLDERVTTAGYVLRLLPFGVALGLFQAPNNRAVMQEAPRERYGVASGLLALSRTLGQVTGLPLMVAIFALRVTAAGGEGADPARAPAAALVRALGETFRVSSVFALAATFLAVLAWRSARRSEGT